MHRATYCAHNYPLPLLPSGPGGVGGITSRRTRHWTSLPLTAWASNRCSIILLRTSSSDHIKFLFHSWRLKILAYCEKLRL